jgi:hypothetical protein
VRSTPIFCVSDVTPTAVRLLSVDVPAEPYAKGVVPSAQPNIVGPYCASQGVTSAPSLDAANPADFTDFTATIQKADGNLYGVLPFGTKDGNGFSRNVLGFPEPHGAAEEPHANRGRKSPARSLTLPVRQRASARTRGTPVVDIENLTRLDVAAARACRGM